MVWVRFDASPCNTLQDRCPWEMDLGLIGELSLVRLRENFGELSWVWSELSLVRLGLIWVWGLVRFDASPGDLLFHVTCFPQLFFHMLCSFFNRIGLYRNWNAHVSDTSRYVSGIGRCGREIRSHRYIGEYPTRHSHFPLRTGRYGTYRPIFRTLISTEIIMSTEIITSTEIISTEIALLNQDHHQIGAY